MSNTRTPRKFNDRAGRELVAVELANGKGEALLLAADYDRVIAAGAGVNWYFVHSGDGYTYVRADHAGTRNLITIARIITAAAGFETVHYSDGDTRNLLPENLVIANGFARMDCSASGLSTSLPEGSL